MKSTDSSQLLINNELAITDSYMPKIINRNNLIMSDFKVLGFGRLRSAQATPVLYTPQNGDKYIFGLTPEGTILPADSIQEMSVIYKNSDCKEPLAIGNSVRSAGSIIDLNNANNNTPFYTASIQLSLIMGYTITYDANNTTVCSEFTGNAYELKPVPEDIIKPIIKKFGDMPQKVGYVVSLEEQVPVHVQW